MDRLIEGKERVSRDVVIDADVVEESNKLDNNFRNINYEKKDNNKVNLGVVIILSVVLSLLSGFLGAYLVISNVNSGASATDGVVMSNLSLNETSSIADAVSKVYDAVAVVEVYSDNNLISTGTGFVYKLEGDKAYLMTNNHVISEGKEIKVLFPNGAEVSAEVVGSDIYSDIAVISIDKTDDVVSAVMGSTEKSNVGDTVFTVGSPEGSDYAGTVTKGILSAKDRVVEVALASSSSYDYYMDVIQTDAAINPGNSGGPICNINGEVIGITNMKLVDDTVEGMGFAIPIEDALLVAEILESEGKVARPYVGIEMLDLNNEINLWRAGILIPEGVNSGVVVYKVVKDAPANKAGLQKGDIIVKLGDKEIDNLADFRYELYKYSPESEVSITFVRDGEELVTKMILGKSE